MLTANPLHLLSRLQVDRSGAYIARQAAKSVVAAGLARRCLVQVRDLLAWGGLAWFEFW